MNSYVKQYLDSFGDPKSESGSYLKDSRLAKAYEVALDIRKFEIELYWKRSASFWLLVGGITAALGLLLSGKSDGVSPVISHKAREFIGLVLCMSGAIICYAWRLVNDGSKFWQRNWEYQVGILEQQVLGPLYKTVMSSKKDKVMYSVSEINGNISMYLFYVFAAAALALLFGKEIQYVLFGMYRLDENIVALHMKLWVAVAHVIFFVKLRLTGRNRINRESFDSSIEVSVRQIFIERQPYGTGAAQKIWNDPKLPEVIAVGKNKKGLISRLGKWLMEK